METTMDEHAKHILDLASVSVAFATLVSWLPSIAALLSIVWTGVRIYESKTVQKWLSK
jgi:hypothetical protein